MRSFMELGKALMFVPNYYLPIFRFTRRISATAKEWVIRSKLHFRLRYVDDIIIEISQS